VKEHDVVPLSVEDDDQGELDEVTGASAKARWRDVRLLFFAGLVIYSAVLLISWLLWHRTPSQLTWIGCGLVAFDIAVLVWKHGLVGFSYSQEGSESVFESKRSPVPRELATPVLVLAGILFFLAGTSTHPGRWLASIFSWLQTIFGGLQTLSDAGQNVIALLELPLAIPLLIVVLLVFTGVGLAAIAFGIYQFLLVIVRGFLFIVRGFRVDPEWEWEGVGLGHLFVGVLSLTMVVSVVYQAIFQHDMILNEFLEPFRTIRSWLT
jgi:hypothetical protein